MQIRCLQSFTATTLLAFGFSAGFSAMAASPNVNAPQGGNFNYNMGGEPPTIHPVTSTDAYSRFVKNYVCESLAGVDPNTYEPIPLLAEKWEISKDSKTFTFFLKKDAKFHNGQPVTAEDVKFSFDAIHEPKFQAIHLRPYFEKISSVEVVDPHTIRFTAKEVYFKNFESLAHLLTVIPKSVYADTEKSLKMTRTAICSGPYKVDKFDRGQSIRLKKNPDWHGFKSADKKGLHNFETITFRFYKESNIALERLKRGDVDYHYNLTDEDYVTKTKGDPWGKSVFAMKVENKQPKRYSFIGWNFKNPLFQDKNVRKALAHLANREEMNKKFRHDLSFVAQTAIDPVSDLYPKDLVPLQFDPKKGLELLTKAGWKDTDKDGILDKVIAGRKTNFEFEITYAVRDPWDKYLLMFQEDLKKVGIRLNLNYQEWNSFSKAIENSKFDGIAMAWGGGSVEPDPKQIWHSSSADQGGSNYISYKNKEVDRLIDEARVEMNASKRAKLFQTVYKKIGEDSPYLFMFAQKYIIFAKSNKVSTPADSFVYDIGLDSWWSASAK